MERCWARSMQIGRANTLDQLIGHWLPAMLRAAGLVDVEVDVHARAEPPSPGTYHRKHLLALVAAVRGEIMEQGLFTNQEMDVLASALERHLENPDTLVTRPVLFQAWGRKPN